MLGHELGQVSIIGPGIWEILGVGFWYKMIIDHNEEGEGNASKEHHKKRYRTIIVI